MTVGERIRQKRCELDMSQTELAKRANYCDKSRISKIENSGNDISMKQVRRIADALGVSTAYLMGWEEQLKEFSEEVGRQTKSLRDFAKTHTIDYNRIIEELIKQFGEKEVEHAIVFVNAYLKASPERQKIALEILQQSHQVDPLPHRLLEDTESATQ